MPDESTQTSQSTEHTDDQQGSGTTTSGTAPTAEQTADQLRKLRAEQKERRLENERLKGQLAQMQAEREGSKSEAQKTAERIASIEAELQRERTGRLRLRVAAEHGLPADLADYLQGDDEEALLGSAERLKAHVATQTATRRTDAGQRANGQAPAGSPSDWLRERLRAR